MSAIKAQLNKLLRTMNEVKNGSVYPLKWKIHETPQDCGFIPSIAVTLWLGWNGIVLCLVLYAIIFASSWERNAIFGLMTMSFLLPPDFPGKAGHKLGDWIMLRAEEYFGLRTIIEDEEALQKHSDKAIIYAFSPHDMLPFGVFAFNPILNRVPNGSTMHCLMTSAIFNIPFLKHVYTWVKGKPVDKKTFMGKLHQNSSFTFCPGGVQEVTLLDKKRPDDIVLYLRNRKGFIKLALSTGSPIVPVFGFNLDGTFGYWFPRGALIEKLSRMIGFLPVIYWGRFGVPFGIPHPKRLTVVVGLPIDVPKMGEVTNEKIDEYHQLFVDELIKLFERHKHNEGYGNKRLKIA